MKLHNAMIAIAVIYLLALCVLVPLTIYWCKNRHSLWVAFLVGIIFLTIITAAFEYGLIMPA